MVIHKYTIPRDGIASLPKGAVILSTAFQGATLCLWAMHNGGPFVHRRMVILATGEQHASDNAAFVGTVHKDGFVFHIFDRGEVA